MAKPSKLRFIRIFDFSLIPKYLIEQIEELPYKPEKVYEYAKEIGSNPFTMLYCMADAEHRIRGFFWGTLNPLDESLYIHMLSIEKGYQKEEKFLRKVFDFLDKLTETTDLVIHFSVSKPKIFERLGAKRSKLILMDYKSEARVEPEKENEGVNKEE